MRFGLIGAGGIGRVRAKALGNTEGCELVAVADTDQARARAVQPSPPTLVFTDFQKMLTHDEVEAIVISTPPQFHEEIAVAAMEAGKHVLCEKPLSNSLDACRRIVEASRRTGKTLATGFNHRYFPAVQFVKQTLESGLIGELDHVRSFAGHTGLAEFSQSWMWDKQVIGGGALMDNGIHIIDLTRYLLGEIVEVFGFATAGVWKLDHSEDNGCAILRNTQGKHATLQATWTEWKGYRFYVEAYGSKGMARAWYAPMFSMAVYMDEPGAPRRRRFNFYPGHIIQEKLFGWQLTTEQSFRREFADFVKLCAGKSSPSDQSPQSLRIADGFAGFRAVEIANAVYRSSETGEAVRLTEHF
jgi:predicted dehydrogenase